MARRVLGTLVLFAFVTLAILERSGERLGGSRGGEGVARAADYERVSSADAPEPPAGGMVPPPRSVAAPGRAHLAPVPQISVGPLWASEGQEAEIEVVLVSAETGALLADLGVELELEQWVVVLNGRPATIGETDAEVKPEGARWAYHGFSHADEEGRYRFDALKPGDYQLFVGRMIHLCILRLEAGEHRKVTVPLSTTCDLPYDAVVVDSISGEPIPRAWADFFDLELESHDGPPTRVIANDDGRLSVRVPSSRPVQARVGGERHAMRVVTLAGTPMSPDSPQRIALDPLGELEVSVLDEGGRTARGIAVLLETREREWVGGLLGTPIEIEAESWLGVTDLDGLATFSSLPPGQELFASLPHRRVTRPILLSPGEHARTTLHMLETALSGVARDHTGAPVAELSVWLLRPDSPAQPGAPRRLTDADHTLAARTTTDRNGRFSFVDVLPGTWWLGPSPPGDPPAHGYAPSAVAIEVLASDLVLEVLLTLEPAR